MCEKSSHNCKTPKGVILLIFRMIKEELYNFEIGFYTAYGIEVLDENSYQREDFVSDLFLYEDEAEEFVNLLNECQPELVHFKELCFNAIE